jgi:hypothetical protein
MNPVSRGGLDSRGKTRLHQGERWGDAPALRCPTAPGVTVEQRQLGESNVGTDGVTVGMSWTWETGWTARTGYRLSGQDEW